jgi:RNA polymerase primary sigma factor
MNHAILTDLFMSDANRYEPMTPEIEKATLKAYKETGDPIHKENLIKHNVRFVMYVANQYKRDGISPLEFVNIGILGLDKAIEKYDMDSGKKLITMAVYWIKASISEYLRDNANLIRLPANQHLKLQKALRNNKEKEIPLADEVAELFNLTQDGSSFSDPVGNDGDDSITIEDTIHDDHDTPYDRVERTSLQSSIMDALGTLPEKQKKVMLGLFGFEGEVKTLTQVGADNGITYERVRQLKVKAIETLQESHPELKELIGVV